MAKNKPAGDGHRIGAVKERSQLVDQKGDWTKRGPDGRFMDQKKGEPFKGVRKEK